MNTKENHFESRVTSVEVNDKIHCHYVTYKKERKRLFGLLKPLPAGYYSDSDRYLGLESDLLNGSYYLTSHDGEKTTFILICENQKAYYRPSVTIKFESDKGKNFKFNTLEECNAYAKELSHRFNLLNVTYKL